MKKAAVIHYDEIALKRGNRPFFEQKLEKNVRNALPEGKFNVQQSWGGRTFVHAKKEWLDEYDQQVLSTLSRTPGAAVFGVGFKTRTDLEQITEAAVAAFGAHKETPGTFRVSASRSDKTFPLSSQDVERKVGKAILDAFSGTRVQLKSPEVTMRVQVLKEHSYVYIKQDGIGGLPVGSTGSAVALLSGGFDSPVATFLAAKRGVKPYLLHFHAHPQTSLEAIEKVRELGKVLAGFTGPLELVLIGILDAQKEVAANAAEKLRVILYRRLMMRVAERWAQEVGAKAIVSGESVGQVASQTLENIGAISDAVALPVLRPLCGFNKNEIIDLSRQIGTHDISAQPHDDTCTVFMPDKPETMAKLDEVHAAEKAIDTEALVAHMCENMEIEKISR